MKLKDLFLNHWCDGEGMPWLTVTPWAAISMTAIEATIDIKDALSEYVRHVPSPDSTYGVKAVYEKHDARVTVRYDLEDLSLKVVMSISPHGLFDGLTLYSPTDERMLKVLHSLSSEALRHGSSTDSGWSWNEVALFAKVLVESIGHDEDFIGDAAKPFRLERYIVERNERHPDETLVLNERDQALVQAHRAIQDADSVTDALAALDAATATMEVTA
tara:strand:- start:626 stop:1276 length:651 start_codon:yes stop_codon:yes gene_type:complete